MERSKISGPVWKLALAYTTCSDVKLINYGPSYQDLAASDCLIVLHALFIFIINNNKP